MEVWGGNRAVDSAVSLDGLDVWVYCRPYQSALAGGDVYYVSTCATGRIARLLVADVSGHGQTVAGLGNTLRRLMRQHVNHADLEQFVEHMNDAFVTGSADGIFATAVVTTYFAPTRTLTLCNAGHPPPLIYRAADRKWGFLTTTAYGPDPADFPLGIVEHVLYRPIELDLNADDLVLCYTDSLMEICDARGTPLNLDGLQDVVQQLNPGDPATLIARLLSAIERRCGCSIEADDVTLLLFRPNLVTGQTSLLRHAMAPVHLTTSIARSILRGDWRLPLPEFTVSNLGGSIIPALSRYKRPRKAPRSIPPQPK